MSYFSNLKKQNHIFLYLIYRNTFELPTIYLQFFMNLSQFFRLMVDTLAIL